MADSLVGLPVFLPAILVLLAITLVTLGEKRVHGYNYAYLKCVDGEELMPSAMSRYYRCLHALPWLSLFCCLFLPDALNWGRQPLLGLIIMMLTLGLRIWSMRSLGRLWTQRCIFVPGMPRSVSGPYSFFRHPEYLTRALEGVGQILFFGVNPPAIALWIFVQTCAAKICKVESRQLYELSVTPLQMPNGSSTVGASD